MHRLFSSEKQKGIDVFQVPYIFDVSGAGKEHWQTVKQPEQIIFDNRSNE